MFTANEVKYMPFVRRSSTRAVAIKALGNLLFFLCGNELSLNCVNLGENGFKIFNLLNGCRVRSVNEIYVLGCIVYFKITSENVINHQVSNKQLYEQLQLKFQLIENFCVFIDGIKPFQDLILHWSIIFDIRS